jgi:cytochrome c biogenesis protein
LYVRRRRVWIRATEGEDGSTVVELAGLQRSDGGDLEAEVGSISDGVLGRLRPASMEE